MKLKSRICSLASTGIVLGCAIGFFFSAREIALNRYLHYRTFRLIFLCLRDELNRWLAFTLFFMAALFALSLFLRPLWRRFRGRSPGSPAAEFGRRLPRLAGARTTRAASLAIVITIAVLNLALFIDRSSNSPSGPNVVWIYFDALRPDHLGCYGYRRTTSPNIDRLAAGGAVFKNAISQAPATFPSVHSTVTSRWASEFFGASREALLEKKQLTISEMLRNAGYFTAAISSSPVVTDEMKHKFPGGFQQGFDTFDGSAAWGEKRNWYHGSPEAVAQRAVDWLNRNHAKKFFLLLYIMDPHDAYRPPPPYDRLYDPDYGGGKKRIENGKPHYYWLKGMKGERIDLDDRDVRHLEALYDGEIRYADAELGALLEELDRLGLADDTLVVLMSDHGEEFFEHGGLKHGLTLYQEQIRVPLILRYPPLIPAGTAVDGHVVRAIDVVPTILDILGVNEPSCIRGRSLLPLILRRSVPWKEFALSEAYHTDAKAVINGNWKYIHHFETELLMEDLCQKYARGKELYNLKEDPGETVNLYSRHPEIAGALLREMMNALPPGERERLKRASHIELPEGAKEELRSLGYL